MQVYRDGYRDTRDKLLDRMERREGDFVVIAGLHEDYGRKELVREDGVFTVLAEETDFVRQRGTVENRG